jgi:hypothetical protein
VLFIIRVGNIGQGDMRQAGIIYGQYSKHLRDLERASQGRIDNTQDIEDLEVKMFQMWVEYVLKSGDEEIKAFLLSKTNPYIGRTFPPAVVERITAFDSKFTEWNAARGKSANKYKNKY